MLQLLMLFHASLTEFSIFAIASTIVLYVRRGPCVYDDAHIPGACMATCSSMIGLFFHVYCHWFWGPWWNSFCDSFPSRQLKLEEQFLYALSHMGYDIWWTESSVTFPTHSYTRAGVCQPRFMCPSPTYGLGLNASHGLNPGFQTHQAGRKH